MRGLFADALQIAQTSQARLPSGQSISVGISHRCGCVAIHVRCLITNIVSTFKCVAASANFPWYFFARTICYFDSQRYSAVFFARIFMPFALLPHGSNENNRRIQKEHRTWWDDGLFRISRKKIRCVSLYFSMWAVAVVVFSFSTFWFVFKSDRTEHSIHHPSVKSSRFAK